MATEKITVTLPEEQVGRIRELVAAGRSPNVSAFVQHAVGVALFDAEGWQEMLADALQQTGGPLSKSERAWADSVIDAGSPRSRKRSKKAA